MKNNMSILGISAGLCVAAVLNGMDVTGVPEIPETAVAPSVTVEDINEYDQYARSYVAFELIREAKPAFISFFSEPSAKATSWATHCEHALQTVDKNNFYALEALLKECIHPMENAFSIDFRWIANLADSKDAAHQVGFKLGGMQAKTAKDKCMLEENMKKSLCNSKQ
jgi:hypothetical protein